MRGVWGAAAPQGLEGEDAGGLGGGSPLRWEGNIGGRVKRGGGGFRV